MEEEQVGFVSPVVAALVERVMVEVVKTLLARYGAAQVAELLKDPKVMAEIEAAVVAVVEGAMNVPLPDGTYIGRFWRWVRRQFGY
jgi:hypothetical protein